MFSKENISRLFNSRIFTILMIVGLGCAIYLPYLSRLGLYADDWMVLIDKIVNTSQIKLWSIDRPILGYEYTFLRSILGVTPSHWQLLILLVRIIGAIFAFLLAEKFAKVEKRIAFVISLVCLLFPGFLRQPSSVNNLPHIITFTCAILSIYLSMLALDKKKWRVAIAIIVLAIIFELTYLVNEEYFIGLEIGRVIILYLYIRGCSLKRPQWPQALLRIFPYLLIASLFFIWRVFIFQSNRFSTDQYAVIATYKENPLFALMYFGKNYLISLINLLFSAWVVPLYSFLISSSIKDTFLLGSSALICCSAVLFLYIFMAKLDRQSDNNAQKQSGLQLVIVGFLLLLISLIPITLLGRYYVFSGYYDRYSLPALLGISFIIGGLLELIKEKRVASYLFLLAIVFLSVSSQLYNENDYAKKWVDEKSFWQQITWRIPQLQENAVIVSALPPNSSLNEDFEVYLPLNLIYYPFQNFVLKGQTVNRTTEGYFINGGTLTRNFRTIYYQVDYDSIVLGVLSDSKSCVHIIDPMQPNFPTDVDPLVRIVSEKASVGQIEMFAQSHELPENVFESEFPRNWCYYFEKADLARQAENWEEVVSLGKEASELGLQPYDPAEWLPFIDAYAHLGMREDYTQAISEILDKDETRIYLCHDLTKATATQPDKINREINSDICNKDSVLNSVP
jgi:hypothetical protein